MYWQGFVHRKIVQLSKGIILSNILPVWTLSNCHAVVKLPLYPECRASWAAVNGALALP